MSLLSVRAGFDNYTGYGLHNEKIVTHFQNKGHDIEILPIRFDFRDMKDFNKKVLAPDYCRSLRTVADPSGSWEFCLLPPDFRMPSWDRKKAVVFSMWESSRLASKYVENLNAAKHVIVPCEWNAMTFSASGVRVPIKIIPLGIDTKLYSYEGPRNRDKFVVGAAGRLEVGGVRKAVDEVVTAFKKAFEGRDDVELWVKGFPDYPLCKSERDPRIKTFNSLMDDTQMREWYAGIDCFVSLSRGESWGLMPLQAMAVGRPAIQPLFSGAREYFNDEVGWPVEFELEPAFSPYEGIWSHANQDHVIEILRFCYHRRSEVMMKGYKAALHAKKFSWDRANDLLEKHLIEIGVI